MLRFSLELGFTLCLFVGIEIVLNGWCALMLGLAVKSIPGPPSTPPSTEAA